MTDLDQHNVLKFLHVLAIDGTGQVCHMCMS